MAEGLDSEEVCGGRQSRVGELCFVEGARHAHAVEEDVGRLGPVDFVHGEPIPGFDATEVRDGDGFCGSHAGHVAARG